MPINKEIVSSTSIIQIPFFDIDVMRVVWHGHYVKYMEIARCDLLETIGYNYDQMRKSGFMFPVVDMKIKYISPARFGQKIEIHSSIVEYDMQLKINYLIKDAVNHKKLCKAYTKQVAVDIESFEMAYSTPQILLDKLSPYIMEDNL